MKYIVKWLIVCAMLMGGLVTAHAAQRHHKAAHQRQIGLSFSVHVGGPIKRQVSHLPHREAVVRSCSPRQVSAIARIYGIRYQTIYRNSRTMTVIGYRNGQRTQICFSREPDCHVIR